MSDMPSRPGLDRDRRNAIIGLSVLVLAAVGIVGAAIVFTDSPSAPTDGLAITEEQQGPAEAPGGMPEDAPGDGEAAPSDGAEGAIEEPGEAEESPSGSPDGTEEVDFDGVCTVEVDREGFGDDRAELRPWRFEECTSAPVVLADAEDERWIVVVASLSGSEFDEAGALDRAEGHGLDGNVLWSSHYPSLNPDLWVVFDGPFEDQDAAADAATDRGGGAYARLLADEAGARY